MLTRNTQVVVNYSVLCVAVGTDLGDAMRKHVRALGFVWRQD